MGVLSPQHTWCDALILQAVSDVLNVTICINESIEGWAPVTIISPISGQQGTTATLAVISYGSHHLSLSVTVSNIVMNICKVCWRNV